MSNDLARRYFDAWNNHDPAAISSCFAPDGTYSDPSAGTMPGAAVGGYAQALVAAFPDLRFDIESESQTADGRVVAQWVMRGTNNGPFGGGPPTGNEIALPGVDIISFAGGGIHAVRGYFDQRTLVDQLGLQVIVQPHEVGPFSFGMSTRVHGGNTAKPGAVSVTWLDAVDDDQGAYVRTISRDIATHMLGMPGFISWYGVIIGPRMLTLTAWEDAESAQRLQRDDLHREGVKRVFAGDVATALHTSVWAPNHLNPLWLRCPECGAMVNAETADGRCQCGALLDTRASWL